MMDPVLLAVDFQLMDDAIFLSAGIYLILDG